MWMRNRRLQLLFLLLVSIFIFTSWVAYSNQSDLSNEDFIRFHVIANSDSEEDQQLKLKVRDGILAKINSELVREAMKNHNSNNLATDAEHASLEEKDKTATLDLESSRQYINNNIISIEETAERIIKENGHDYSAAVELGVKWIPQKTYGDITFPAGNYEALNITIGEGKGQNWWCVLFPPLCLIGVESPDQAQSLNEAQDIYKEVLVDRKYDSLTAQNKQPTTLKLKFKTLEIINEWNK